jgi:hypothetical protein
MFCHGLQSIIANLQAVFRTHAGRNMTHYVIDGYLVLAATADGLRHAAERVERRTVIDAQIAEESLARCSQ